LNRTENFVIAKNSKRFVQRIDEKSAQKALRINESILKGTMKSDESLL
jgi:hypothetical protein